MDEYLDEQFDSNEEQHWISSNQDKNFKKNYTILVPQMLPIY